MDIKDYYIGTNGADIKGKIMLRVGSDIYKEQNWVPVLISGENDPTWVKASCVERLEDFLKKEFGFRAK